MIFFVAFLLLLASGADAAGWTDCMEGSTSPLSGLNLVLKPNPPQPGNDLTVSGSATFSPIPGGYAGATILNEGIYFGQTFLKDHNDLCDSFGNATSAACQSKKNISATFSTTNSFPNETWTEGFYTLLHTIKDVEGNFLSCLKLDVVMPGHKTESQSSKRAVRLVNNDDRTLDLALIPSATDLSAPSSFDCETQWPALKKTPGQQGQCGSCWSWAMTDQLAGRLTTFGGAGYGKSISMQVPVSFYSQVSDRCNGCNGGNTGICADMIRQNDGLPDLSCVPYHSSNCLMNSPDAKDGCTSSMAWQQCTSSGSWKTWGWYSSAYMLPMSYASGESAMMNYISTYGPMAVSFRTHVNFMNFDFSSKIYTSTQGSPEFGGHAVVIYGYGVNSAGTKWWKFKNSWGTGWGVGGYGYILRGSNLCGIESRPLQMPMTSDSNLALKARHLKLTQNSSSPDIMAGGWLRTKDVQHPTVAAAFFQLAVLTAAQRAPTNTKFESVLEAHTQVVEGINVRLLVQHADSAQRSEHTLHRPLGSHSHLLISSKYH